jgi:hypothetical protein
MCRESAVLNRSRFGGADPGNLIDNDASTAAARRQTNLASLRRQRRGSSQLRSRAGCSRRGQTRHLRFAGGVCRCDGRRPDLVGPSRWAHLLGGKLDVEPGRDGAGHVSTGTVMQSAARSPRART